LFHESLRDFQPNRRRVRVGDVRRHGYDHSRTRDHARLFARQRHANYVESIDRRCKGGYSWASALTGRLLPAAREASHLFPSFKRSLPSFSLVSAGHRHI